MIVARLPAFLRFLVVFHLTFHLTYFGLRALRQGLGQSAETGWHLYFSFETAMPLVPWMIWPYASVGAAFLLPLFHLEARQIDRLSRQIVLAMLGAAASFMTIPARLGFPPMAVDGLHGAVYALLHALDAPDNLIPSLHVTNMALVVGAVSGAVSRKLKIAYGLWLALLAVATVLTHQHHLLDVATGLALALVVRHLLPLTCPARVPAPQETS